MLIFLLAVSSVAARAPADLPARILENHARGDRDACAALLRESPASALPTVEKWLDEALALRDSGRAEDVAPARGKEEIALWTARIARDAIGAPLLADLAASRAGWSESDRRLFREARSVHAKAAQWIEKGENRFGLEAGQETTTRASLLGDWHGAAMGCEAEAIGHQALSSLDDALAAWSRARILWRDLGARGEELACQRAVAEMCYATERFARGREAADQAAGLAESLGDRKAQAELLLRRAGFEEKLGLREAAEATRAAAKALGG